MNPDPRAKRERERKKVGERDERGGVEDAENKGNRRGNLDSVQVRSAPAQLDEGEETIANFGVVGKKQEEEGIRRREGQRKAREVKRAKGSCVVGVCGSCRSVVHPSCNDPPRWGHALFWLGVSASARICPLQSDSGAARSLFNPPLPIGCGPRPLPRLWQVTETSRRCPIPPDPAVSGTSGRRGDHLAASWPEVQLGWLSQHIIMTWRVGGGDSHDRQRKRMALNDSGMAIWDGFWKQCGPSALRSLI